MGSLRLIMDMDDDSDSPDVRGIKREAAPTTSSTQQAQGSSSGPASQSHASSRNPASARQSVTTSAPPAISGSSRRRNTSSSRVPTTRSPALPSPSNVSSSVARRDSVASNDSMDYTGYGSAASSSSRGGGGRPPNRGLSRPMADPSGNATPQVRLTPITKRVSRAKKGVPVHVCETCRPAKIFTRAEHLRRHQQSHQAPMYACTVPGCDKTFHRQDLLNRHQSRHEIEGDQISSPGRGGQDDDDSNRASVSSQYSIPTTPGLASSSMLPSAARERDGPNQTSSTSTEPHSTSNLSGSSYRVTSPTSQSASTFSAYAMSSPPSLASYNRPSRPVSQPYDHYPIHTSFHGSPGMSAPALDTLEYIPTTGPASVSGLFPIVTQGLPPQSHTAAGFGGPHDMIAAQDTSPWPSSNSDTGSENISRTVRTTRYPRTQSPVPNWPSATGYMTATTGAYNVSSAPMYFGVPASPQNQQHGFGAMYEPSMAPYSLDNTDAAMMDSYTTSHGQSGSMTRHHRHSHSLSSVRSSTPPLSTNPNQPNQALVTPSSAPSSRLSNPATLGRQKAMLMGDPFASVNAGMSVGGLGIVREDEANPSGNVNGLLAAYPGGCGMPGVVRGVQLPRAIRNAIPGYLALYWERFHSLFPIVHHPSMEDAGEGVLQCAMAAIGTQYLDSKEDRARGSTLHETAVQELKRYPQWNLQIMQAVLLLEYFARFRGRKAAVQPSRRFRSLYSRVSSPEFLSFTGADASSSLFQVTTDWSSSSSSASSSATVTPTSPAARILQPSLLAPAFPLDFSTSFPSSLCPPGPFQQLTAATPPDTPLLGQQYSPFAQWQARFPNQSQYGAHVLTTSSPPAPLSSQNFRASGHKENKIAEEQAALDQVNWRSWVEEEARRRLLQGCFLLDIHSSMLFEQRRTTELEYGVSQLEPNQIPLVGRSGSLWSARSATEWASLVAVDPGAAEGGFVSSSEQWTCASLLTMSPIDNATLLASEVSRLLHQEPVEPFSPSIATPTIGSFSGEFDPTSLRHAGIATGGSSLYTVPPTTQESPMRSLQAAPAAHASTQPIVSGGVPADGETSNAQMPSVADQEVRIGRLYSNSPIAQTYLALLQTPLRSLSAVSGESWVFSQKLMDAGSFQDHQKRLRIWVDQGLPGGHGDKSSLAQGMPTRDDGVTGLSPEKAAIHATRALLGFLDRELAVTRAHQPALRTPSRHWMADISDYWALNVCALIIWAYSRRNERPLSSASMSSVASSSAAATTTAKVKTSDTMSAEEISAAETGLEAWLRGAVNARSENIGQSLGRPEASLVVGFVRRRLDLEAKGGKSCLLNDACSVLKKLEEGVNWPWF